MLSNKFECLTRIKAVEREYVAARYATDFLLKAAYQDPTILNRKPRIRDIRVRDIEESSGRLEGTYVIRLFAEFETILRAFWTASRGVDPPSRTRDLLDGIGAKRKVPHDTIHHAHEIRDFRNTLVHERDDAIEPVPIALARNYLCVFVNFLPLEW
jgi:hypothetical protein